MWRRWCCARRFSSGRNVWTAAIGVKASTPTGRLSAACCSRTHVCLTALSAQSMSSPERKPELPVRGRRQLCDRRRPGRCSRPTSLAQYARHVVGLLGNLHHRAQTARKVSPANRARRARAAGGRRSARRRECPPRTRAAGARATGASTARPSCSLRSSRTSSARHARRRAGVVWAARRASSGRPPRGATSGPPGHRGISSSEASVGARARTHVLGVLGSLRSLCARSARALRAMAR